MFYVLRIKGWPVLVWLEVEPADGRYDVVGRSDNVIKAMAGFHEALERARATLRPRPTSGPGVRYASGPANTMSPRPPEARKSAT